MRDLYIGLMSGTSADGIDAALVDFNSATPLLVAHHFTEFSSDLRERILALNHPGHDEINRLGELDHILGKAFADAANTLLAKSGIATSDIRAIGSHGQTIRHHPQLRFTLQIADPNMIAAKTGITTVADFRRRDMAYGGQGAPLVPAFHQTILRSKDHDRAVVNIGGVANITFLPCDLQKSILGFDTGPGNNLMDAWIQQHLQKTHDKNGEWAKQGIVSVDLLKKLLNDAYFKMIPPKSTGPEYFNLAWLNKHLGSQKNDDVQATLAELTAITISNAIKNLMNSGEVLICGGGVHNQYLMQRLTALLKPFDVLSTEKYGVHPDWMEAMAFAWLAKQTLEKKPGNVMQVTGAKEQAILGGVYQCLA
jgi:anhydro-N-acetylmuramic acid kinase